MKHMNYENDIEGVIYPLPKIIVERINENKNIFVKYLARPPKKKGLLTKLKVGDTLFVYQSGSEKEIVINALIKKIEFLLIEEVIHSYKNKTIADENELRRYSKGRESKPLLVLHLTNIKRYDSPLKVNVPITMAGRYITTENKNKLLNL
jgi:hypothetical protein